MPRFVKLQMVWLAISLAIPAVCMVVNLAEAADPLLLSDIALLGLLAAWVIALVTPWVAGGGSPFALRGTAFVLTWSAIAIIFPLTWDLPWAILHDWVNGATANDVSKWYFWAYAVADTRFLHSDHIMILVEYWSGVIGIIEIAFVRMFLRNNLVAALPIAIAAGCLQFYACTVFFGSELLNGMSNIRPDVFSYIKFFGLNGMWMIVPALSGGVLLWLTRAGGYNSQDCLRVLFGREPRRSMAHPPPATAG